ncbi:MAG: SusC/RagA family TonB-linked outer membrane protein [Dysgonamonadaceae bacterium]|nr:SusC/RagA family TonB-linked outer membrane protein [Dysgonamonadaceae bacterium]
MKKNIILSLIFLLFMLVAEAQTRQIRGKVTDAEDRSALSGVFVSVVGNRNIGTTTGIDGGYSIDLERIIATGGRQAQLRFQLLGYETVTVGITEDKNVYDVSLKIANNDLDEVIITAAGIARSRRQPGYSNTKVTGSEITQGKSASIAGGLTAKIPGLQVNAISSGVNPSYRLVLRGNRSITGDNTALIVVDGAIVTSAVLNNLNPEDIEDIQVLNGAAGATLYGSEASNGVLLITTKKGVKGKPQIKLSHTTTLEQISFFPKTQTRFGQGSTADGQIFEAVENQQYGPAFDGSLRELGYPLENGEQQYAIYSPTTDRNDFWETGIQNQTDLSFSFGNDNSTSYISAQYLDVKGTTPSDAYNRISLRLNNTRKVLSNLNLAYNASYVENNYDITTATDYVYEDLLNLPANIPLLQYKDWRNGKWANPDGWFNPWYENPYWMADNYRNDAKNTYLTGKVELKWDIKPWISVLYRASLSNRYYQTKQTISKYTYSDYSQSVQGKTNFPGYVYDNQQNWYRLNQDFQASLAKIFGDLDLNLTLGASNVNKSWKGTSESATGLVVPGLFNIGNRSGTPTVSSNIEHARNYGFWGDFVAGYKNYLYLHLTGRNDWTSLLSKENRSYFYPSADVSFIASDAIESLKDGFFDYLKIRAAVSETGNVNIDPYSLLSTFSSTTGYSKGTYFRESGTLIAKDLKPEITKGWEIGTEFKVFKNFAELQFTYYFTSTTGEAISSSIATSSGYSELLLNCKHPGKYILRT